MVFSNVKLVEHHLDHFTLGLVFHKRPLAVKNTTHLLKNYVLVRHDQLIFLYLQNIRQNNGYIGAILCIFEINAQYLCDHALYPILQS